MLVEHAARYGEFTVGERVWDLEEPAYDRMVERFEAGAAGGAGVWLTREDAVLLVRHEGEEAWSDPGGKREADESFLEAARREAREEAGVEFDVQGVLEVHVVSHVAPARPPVVSPIVIFEGRHAGGRPDPDADDRVAEARWFAERPDSVLYHALETFPMPSDDGG